LGNNPKLGYDSVHRSKMDGRNKGRLQQKSDIHVSEISINISRQGKGRTKAKEDTPTECTSGVVEVVIDDD